MSLQTDIKEKIKEAMLAKDQVRLGVMRMLTSAFTNELVAKGKKPTEELSDDEALAVIARLAKQRKDSISQFEAGGRMDLVEEEKGQLTILEEFLPEMMGEDEVRSFVSTKKTELGVDDPKDKGKLMSEVMKELKGRADGGIVKSVVDSLF
ncbi:MAG: GatB/YqeY domain-containing protein [Candidatus Nomurabacteria bacterium]|nr:MAG: GatB/YqeY domain-containing protein [Candidatus Nomurabacteria bacterium]